MKIIYAANPLKSYFILDEKDKRILMQALTIEEYEDVVFTAQSHIEEKEYDQAVQCLYITNTLDELYDMALSELQDGEVHMGDCTCVPASCFKCHMESLMGVNSLEGLGKHQGHAVELAFAAVNPTKLQETEETLDQAIEYLNNYKPSAKWEGWEVHADRWKQRASSAHDWLVDYRNNKLGVIR